AHQLENRTEVQSLAARGALLWVSDPEAGLRLEAAHGGADRGELLRQAESLGPLARAVERQRSTLVVPADADDPRLPREVQAELGALTLIAIQAGGRALGVLGAFGDQGASTEGVAEAAGASFLEARAAQAAQVIEQARPHDRLRALDARVREAQTRNVQNEQLAT